MAKPIQLDIPTRDYKAELQQQLAEAPVEHAGAILEFLELLEVLHEKNVLSTLRGAVGAGGDIIGNLAHAAAQPEAVRAMRNLVVMAKILGKIDPELLDALQKSIPPELSDRYLRRMTPKPSLWKIAKLMFSTPVRRTLMAAGFMMAGVGYYLGKETPSMSE